jgi:hypothetical protein
MVRLIPKRVCSSELGSVNAMSYEKRHVDPTASGDSSFLARYGKHRSSDVSLYRPSSYTRSMSVVSTGSRLDATSGRLKAEEELWESKLLAAQRHREEVKRRAEHLESQARERAAQLLKAESDRSRQCISANQAAFAKHVERARQLQDIRQRHVEDQAAVRRRWEAALGERNDQRTNEAEERHFHLLAARRDSVRQSVDCRATEANARLAMLKRHREQLEADVMHAEAAKERVTRELQMAHRENRVSRQQHETSKVVTAVSRAQALEQRRIAAIRAAEDATARRTAEVLQARAQELQLRQQRKARAEQEANKRRASVEASAARRRESLDAHFQETVAVGNEAREHNRRVHASAMRAKWF